MYRLSVARAASSLRPPARPLLQHQPAGRLLSTTRPLAATAPAATAPPFTTLVEMQEK